MGRAEELADHRYGEALWYAFGAEDTMRAIGGLTHTKVDPFGFATFAKDESYLFYMEKVTSLDSVQGQFQRWLERQDNASNSPQ